MSDLAADRYERLLTQYDAMQVDYLAALRELHTLRAATMFLVGAACRTAGEYRIPIRMSAGKLHPLTAEIGVLLGTATFRAMELLPRSR